MLDNPLVSICCITYNHAPYIRQCLDGFLMQKTNFKYEIVIHDDCSTDGTTEIIKEYAFKYPDIFVPLYEDENQYSKGVRGISAKFVYPKARGKYIALCEGDDYWIDENKLQIQVDFLERNPEYTMCFHNAIEHYEDGSVPDKEFSQVENRDYSGIEFFKHWIVPTASVVIRKVVIENQFYNNLKNDPDLLFGDTPLFLTASKFGKVYGSSIVMAVYRRQENGASYGISLERNRKHIKHNNMLAKYFPDFKRKICIVNIKIRCFSAAIALMNNNKKYVTQFLGKNICLYILMMLYYIKYTILKKDFFIVK